MKQDETDPTGELDAGWDEGDGPEESGRTVALPLSGRAVIAKPSSGPPPADETDELDEAWGAEEPAAAVGSAPTSVAPSTNPPKAASPEEDDLDEGWEHDEDDEDEDDESDEGTDDARSVDEVGADTAGSTRGPARASFKKAHRLLRLKNQEHARRSKKTRKAERKAKRREEARLGRERREEEARLERELKARREREKKARAKKAEPPPPTRAKNAVERARRSSEPAPSRSDPEQRHERLTSRAPGATRKKRKQASLRAQRRERLRLAAIVLLGLAVVALVAWRLGAS